MSHKPKYVLNAEERDRKAEQRYQEILARAVMPSTRKPVFVTAEDIDSNAWLACPNCGGTTIYGMTRRVHICLNCNWYHVTS